jgi:hypothetical protein
MRIPRALLLSLMLVALGGVLAHIKYGDIASLARDLFARNYDGNDGGKKRRRSYLSASFLSESKGGASSDSSNQTNSHPGSGGLPNKSDWMKTRSSTKPMYGSVWRVYGPTAPNAYSHPPSYPDSHYLRDASRIPYQLGQRSRLCPDMSFFGAISILGSLFVGGVSARPTGGDQHRGRNGDGYDESPGSPTFTCLLVLVTAPVIHQTLRAYLTPREQAIAALTLTGVISLLWWTLLLTADSTNDLAVAGCSWAAAFLSLLDSCARCLRRAQLFVVLTVFFGGGVPLLLATVFIELSSIDTSTGSMSARSFEAAIKAGPLCLTGWTWLIFMVESWRIGTETEPRQEDD